MRAIGKRGFTTTLARWWFGDKEGFLRWLGLHQHAAMVERAANQELARQHAAGAVVASVELPGWPLCPDPSYPDLCPF
jgi:hypothetical protein